MNVMEAVEISDKYGDLRYPRAGVRVPEKELDGFNLFTLKRLRKLQRVCEVAIECCFHVALLVSLCHSSFRDFYMADLRICITSAHSCTIQLSRDLVPS